MIKIAAQQPFFLPDFYFFYKLYASDIFLLADHLHFRKQSPIVRARLAAPEPRTYLTVPVSHGADPQPPIRTVQLDSSQDWKRRHLRTLSTLFRQTPYFEHYFPLLEGIYQQDYANLAEFLIALIRWQVQLLFPRRQLYVASQEGIAEADDLSAWAERHRPLEWLVYPAEEEYYRKNLAAFPRRSLTLPVGLAFPPGYAPELPLLVLFFLRGPETVIFFR